MKNKCKSATPIQNKEKSWQTYLITDEELLYKIADARLLHYLRRSAPNKFIKNATVWYFDKEKEIGDMVRQHKIDKKAENKI